MSGFTAVEDALADIDPPSVKLGRAARRRARRKPAPLPPRDGLNAVRCVNKTGMPVAVKKYLLQRYPALADPQATPLDQRLDRGDFVTLDGEKLNANDLLPAGQALYFYREMSTQQYAELELQPTQLIRVVAETEQLLVIDKPHGIASMPRGAHVSSSALVQARKMTGNMELVPIHRLDKDTAGVLVLSKIPAQRALYQNLFAERLVQKTYQAVTVSTTSAGGLPAEIALHLEKRTGQLRTRVRLDRSPNSFTSVLKVRSLTAAPPAVNDRAGTAVYQDVLLAPKTGKTHQLRAHLAACGCPILGDVLYGEPNLTQGGEIQLQLLAKTIEFVDPVTKTKHTFSTAFELAAAKGR